MLLHKTCWVCINLDAQYLCIKHVHTYNLCFHIMQRVKKRVKTRDCMKLWKHYTNYRYITISWYDSMQNLDRTICYEIFVIRCDAKSFVYDLHRWTSWLFKYLIFLTNDIQKIFFTKRIDTSHQHRTFNHMCSIYVKNVVNCTMIEKWKSRHTKNCVNWKIWFTHNIWSKFMRLMYITISFWYLYQLSKNTIFN